MSKCDLDLLGFLTALSTDELCWCDDDVVGWIAELQQLEAEKKRLKEALKLAKRYISGFDGLSSVFSARNALDNIEQALKGEVNGKE